MERVNIRIGPLTFDRADYDADSDVLYLHVGEPQAGEGEETRRAMFCGMRQELAIDRSDGPRRSANTGALWAPLHHRA